MFIEEDVNIMGTLKEIKIACNPKKKQSCGPTKCKLRKWGYESPDAVPLLRKWEDYVSYKENAFVKWKKKKRMVMRNYISAQQVLWKNNAWVQANRNSLIHQMAGLWSMTLFSSTGYPINVVYVLRTKQIIIF